MTVEWMDRALCAQIGGDMWFPKKGGNTAAAVAVCQSCPVAAECLQFASQLNPDEGRHGIWGGLTPRARAALVNNGQRKCVLCRNQYTPTSNGQRLCSDECREQSRRNTYAKSAKKHTAA